MQGEVLGRRLLSGKVRVAYEDQVRAVALSGQLQGQLLHAHAQSARHGVLIGPLEGEEHEVERIRSQTGKSRPWRLLRLSWSVAPDRPSIPGSPLHDARSREHCATLQACTLP